MGAVMEDHILIDRLREYKESGGLTYYDLSKRLDIQIPTLERWFRTKKINRLYAKMVRDKLGL